MPLRVGRFTLHAVVDGYLRLDGGTMFGVVPRTVWSRFYPPDDQNRIRIALRSLFIDAGDRKILVDDGIGDKAGDAKRVYFEVERDGASLDRDLARAGVSRADITDVILTHLHVEHAGGTTRAGPGDGALELAFPNATFHVQRRHLKWARNPTERDARSFRPSDFDLLERSGQLHLIEGETELFEGVQLCVSEGHTVGLQLVRVRADDLEVVFCGDLIPTAAHLKPHYGMAFDLYPLTAMEERKMLLAQAVEEGAILFFEHDPNLAACRVRDEDGVVVVGETVAF